MSSVLPDRDRLESLPVVGAVFAFGAQNLAFDLLILAGPAVIAVVALLGRNPLTTALAAAYILSFVGAVSYAAIRHARD